MKLNGVSRSSFFFVASSILLSVLSSPAFAVFGDMSVIRRGRATQIKPQNQTLFSLIPKYGNPTYSSPAKTEQTQQTQQTPPTSQPPPASETVAQSQSSQPSATSSATFPPAPISDNLPKATGLHWKVPERAKGSIGETSIEQAIKVEPINANEIIDFTRTGELRALVVADENADNTSSKGTYSRENELQVNSISRGIDRASGLDPSLQDSRQEQVAPPETNGMASLLLSDDPWVAQFTRTSLPGVIHQIKKDEAVRAGLKEKLREYLSQNSNMSAQDRKMAEMISAALAQAELEERTQANFVALEKLETAELFRMDPKETRAGIERMIAELANETDTSKLTLFERVRATHRKVTFSQKL